jgi:hypothetical protein
METDFWLVLFTSLGSFNHGPNLLKMGNRAGLFIKHEWWA